MADILEVATREFAEKGLAGARIDEIAEQFVVLEVSAGLAVKMQKQAISAVLPKGTLKSA